MDFVAEASGLDYYTVAAFCAERLMRHKNGALERQVCLELLNSRIENCLYLSKLDGAADDASPAHVAKRRRDEEEEETHSPNFLSG
jgi:hypothetical protein